VKQASYTTAVACALGVARIRHFELAQKIGADWRIALRYLDQMQREGLVGPLGLDGWREVLATRAVATDAPNSGNHAEGSGAQELRLEIEDLRQAHAAALSELSAWRARARQRTMPERVGEGEPEKNGDWRFKALRRLVAKELHPDLSRPGGMEAAVRNALFQRIWPQIEMLQAA
jgi:hypothetical protein